MSPAQLRASLALWRGKYAYRLARETFWKAAKNQSGIAKWDHLRLEAKAKIHQRLKELGLEKPKPAPKPKPTPRPPANKITMYDSITVAEIPKNAEAVAGYVGGNWPTYNSLLKAFPKAHHVSIAVNASEDAMCLDVENGDASPNEAPAWVHRQHERHVERPVIYANLSTMPAVKRALASSNVSRSKVRLWCADWTYSPHIPVGYDACQYSDKALGRNLDVSLCQPGFFN